MVTDSPEFLAALQTLNCDILTSAVTAGTLPSSVREQRIKVLDDAVKEVLERRKVGFSERVKRLHLLRSERQERWEVEVEGEEGEGEVGVYSGLRRGGGELIGVGK